MNPYEIHPATLEDAPAMVEVYYAAFSDDPIMGNFDANVEPQVKRAALTKSYRVYMENAHLTGSHFFKCIEHSSGDIVAFAKWDFPVPLTASKVEEQRLLQKSIRTTPSLEGANISLMKDFYNQKYSIKAKWHDPATDYELHLLATSPAHHRRGIGAMLLAEGVSRADRDGAKIYLEASSLGLPLYLRNQWQVVDEVAVDMSRHGLPELGICIEKCLVREPAGKTIEAGA